MRGRVGMGGTLTLGFFFLMAAAPAAVRPAALGAQEALLPTPALVVTGGAYDLRLDSAEVGSFVSARFDLPLADWSVAEVGAERLGYDFGDGRETRWGATFAVRFEWPADLVRPYAGGSLGAEFDFGGERTPAEPFVMAIYGALVGARVALGDRFGFRAEARLHYVDGFTDRAYVYAAGFSVRL